MAFKKTLVMLILIATTSTALAQDCNCPPNTLMNSTVSNHSVYPGETFQTRFFVNPRENELDEPVVYNSQSLEKIETDSGFVGEDKYRTMLEFKVDESAEPGTYTIKFQNGNSFGMEVVQVVERPDEDNQAEVRLSSIRERITVLEDRLSTANSRIAELEESGQKPLVNNTETAENSSPNSSEQVEERNREEEMAESRTFENSTETEESSGRKGFFGFIERLLG